MKLFHPRYSIFAVVALVLGMVFPLLVAPGAVPAAGAGAAPGKVVLRVALTTGIDSLNPFTAIRVASTQVNRFMYEFLTTYTAADQKVTPGLAESWSTAPDKVTWTFKIRPGMKWSDGTPITARDPAFTYNTMMTNPDAATANGSFTANFASVRAADDSTLVIKTKRPYASMLALDIPVVPEHVWSKVGNIGEFTNEDTTRPVVGSGPYVLTGYREGQVVTLKANENYWRGRPKVDEVQLVTFTDTDAAVQALRKGDVDLVNRLTVSQFKALSGEQGIGVNDGRNRRFTSLLLNPGAATRSGQPVGNGHPALKDVRVRRAIARAVDRQALVDKVFQGHAQVGVSIVPPVFEDVHWEPGDGERQDFDPAAAGRLLDEAGYARGGGGIRADRAGKKLSLRLLAHSDDAVQAQSAEFIKGWLRAVGVEARTEFKSDSQTNEDTTGGNYDLAFSGWNVNPDPEQMLGTSTCSQRPDARGKGSTTADYFCNAEYDRMFAEQGAELDPAKRAAIVKRMQALLYDQVPEVVLVYENSLEAYRSDRFEFDRQPADNGVITGQSGYWWLYGARPVGAADGDGEGGPGTPLVIGILAALALAALAAFLVLRRRTARADERE